jgi:peptidoglycan-associated lipoprotein
MFDAMASRPRHPVTAVVVAATALLLAFSLGGCPNKKPKNPTCDGDADCKDGEVCVNKECKPAPSADGCSSDADCGDGKVCKAGACVACSADAECGPGGKCNAGVCDRPKKCSADEECADDEDCINGVCLNPGAPADPGSASCQLQTVYFAFDDSSIQAAERDRLEQNSTCIEKNATKNVFLVGHTDASGTDEYNIALSERRAQSVADYLSQLGVDPARLSVVPKGETELTGMGDDKDRRVELQWR